jgi:alpha-beta hydrolase superfamily lysophospholipase
MAFAFTITCRSGARKAGHRQVHSVTDIRLSWTTLTWKQGSYDVYMLDARGHGLSDPFTPADKGDTLVKDVMEFVRAMRFEKPILMGHSMRAATVMRLGAEYPDRPCPKNKVEAMPNMRSTSASLLLLEPPLARVHR